MNKNSFSNKDFGVYIKSLRRNYGLTATQLAKKLDISPKTLSRIENGENAVSISRFWEICQYIQIYPAQAIQNFFGSEKKDFTVDWPSDAQKEYRFMVEYLKAKYNIE